MTLNIDMTSLELFGFTHFVHDFFWASWTSCNVVNRLLSQCLSCAKTWQAARCTPSSPTGEEFLLRQNLLHANKSGPRNTDEIPVAKSACRGTIHEVVLEERDHNLVHVREVVATFQILRVFTFHPNRKIQNGHFLSLLSWNLANATPHNCPTATLVVDWLSIVLGMTSSLTWCAVDMPKWVNSCATFPLHNQRITSATCTGDPFLDQSVTTKCTLLYTWPSPRFSGPLQLPSSRPAFIALSRKLLPSPKMIDAPHLIW